MATERPTNSEGFDSEPDLRPEELAWLNHCVGASRVGEFTPDGEDSTGFERSDQTDWQAFLGECRSSLVNGPAHLAGVRKPSVDAGHNFAGASDGLPDAKHESDERSTRESNARENWLIERVLNRTVREDLSVGADWRLVGNFVRQRLSSSGLLRVVAASLLLHLFALPVMAYYVWVLPDREPSIQIHLDPASKDLPYRILEPEVEHSLSSAPKILPPLEDLELVSDLFRVHRAQNTNGESGPADQILWADDLGLILRMEMLSGRQAAGAESTSHLERVRFTLDRLEACLERLRTQRDRPNLRRLGASAWLRARHLVDSATAGTQGTADSLDDSLREFECRAWLGSKGPLDGADWRDACALAESELENSAK